MNHHLTSHVTSSHRALLRRSNVQITNMDSGGFNGGRTGHEPGAVTSRWSRKTTILPIKVSPQKLNFVLSGATKLNFATSKGPNIFFFTRGLNRPKSATENIQNSCDVKCENLLLKLSSFTHLRSKPIFIANAKKINEIPPRFRQAVPD